MRVMLQILLPGMKSGRSPVPWHALQAEEQTALEGGLLHLAACLGHLFNRGNVESFTQ